MASIITKKSFKISISFLILIMMSLQFIWLFSSQINYKHAIVYCLVNGICFLISFLIIGNNLNFYRPANFNYGYLVGWCLFFGAFSLFISKLSALFFLKNNILLHELLSHNLYIHFIFNFLILACYSAVCLIWYHQNEIHENEMRKQEAATLNREAELYNLRQQLQPHFLFNSLNSINALIGSKPAGARKMVNQLSDFLRYTIKKQENELVNLEEEMAHLGLYLDIEKVRFGHRLVTLFTVPEACYNYKIPALLLQPILENAIKYGLYDTLEAVEIQLIAEIIDHNLTITISNPYDAQTSSNKNGTGFGLSSVKKRLQLIYNRADLLKTFKNDSIFTTSITIPNTHLN